MAPPLEQDTRRVVVGGTHLKASYGEEANAGEIQYGSSSGEEGSSKDEIRSVGSSEERTLVEEKPPYVGYLAGAEYSCDSSDCFTEVDGVLKIVTEVNERVDADMEVALALAINMVDRRPAEVQTGRGRRPRVSTALIREL